MGYLKFHKNGKKIKISRISSNPYKLLRLLIEPFGIAKTIDGAYGILSKRKHTMRDRYLEPNRKITAIKYTIKNYKKYPALVNT